MWFFFPSLWWNCVQLLLCIICTYKISCFPTSSKYLRTLSKGFKKTENPTGFMIALEKLAPPGADASLEICTALRKCSALSSEWKEPSPAVVLYLKSMEMVQSGHVCAYSQTCDLEMPHALLERTKVANNLWAIWSPGFARRGHHLGVCLPQWEARQNHNCFSLAMHKDLLGRLTACFSQSPNVPSSGLMELVINLPSLDQSVSFPPWREWGICSPA